MKLFWWILLAAAFAAVGVHLLLLSRRQAALLRRFAETRGLAYRERDDGTLEASLDRDFALDEPGCGRAFSRVRDLVALPHGTLFRAVEALDLNPHARTESPHHGRAAVVFPTAARPAGIFLVSRERGVHQRHPQNAAAGPELAATLERAEVPSPPAPLSLTLTGSRGLAYLEPRVVGSVREEHLVYLADLAERLGRAA